jgi:hypothetical protein
VLSGTFSSSSKKATGPPWTGDKSLASVFASSAKRGGERVMWWTPDSFITSVILVKLAGKTCVLQFGIYFGVISLSRATGIKAFVLVNIPGYYSH